MRVASRVAYTLLGINGVNDEVTSSSLQLWTQTGAKSWLHKLVGEQNAHVTKSPACLSFISDMARK